jgi:hypothetical protein
MPQVSFNPLVGFHPEPTTADSSEGNRTVNPIIFSGRESPESG